MGSSSTKINGSQDKQGSEAKAHPIVIVEFSEAHQVYPEMSFLSQEIC